MAPRGPPLVTADEERQRKGNRRCGREEKKSKNDGLSMTIKTNLRQIALECNGGFFKSFEDGAGARRRP